MGKKWRHGRMFEKNNGQIAQFLLGRPENRDREENVVALRVVTVGMEISTI